jgi:hypothetical protein
VFSNKALSNKALLNKVLSNKALSNKVVLNKAASNKQIRESKGGEQQPDLSTRVVEQERAEEHERLPDGVQAAARRLAVLSDRVHQVVPLGSGD